MTYTVLTASAIVTGVGVCILDELKNTPESGGVTAKMRRCLLVPGNIAWDACDCGQLAQTIQREYPTEVFPVDASQQPIKSGCNSRATAVQVLVSLLRCAPGLDSAGRPPSCDALLAAGIEQRADGYAVRRAVECCLADLKTDRTIFNFAVGGTNYVGPDGGCTGLELTYTFQLI